MSDDEVSELSGDDISEATPAEPDAAPHDLASPPIDAAGARPTPPASDAEKVSVLRAEIRRLESEFKLSRRKIAEELWGVRTNDISDLMKDPCGVTGAKRLGKLMEAMQAAAASVAALVPPTPRPPGPMSAKTPSRAPAAAASLGSGSASAATTTHDTAVRVDGDEDDMGADDESDAVVDYLYLIEMVGEQPRASDGRRHYKIGVTADLNNRVRLHQTSNPYELRYVTFVPVARGSRATARAKAAAIEERLLMVHFNQGLSARPGKTRPEGEWVWLNETERYSLVLHYTTYAISAISH